MGAWFACGVDVATAVEDNVSNVIEDVSPTTISTELGAMSPDVRSCHSESSTVVPLTEKDLDRFILQRSHSHQLIR